MIQANCRNRLTDDDFKYISEALARDSRQRKVALVELLTDPETRDAILDDADLCASVVDKSRGIRVSPFLYFYLLTRRAFLRHGIADRDLADYVASMLAQFSATRRAHSASHLHDKSYHYLVDMMSDSLQASSFEAFLLRSHIGNYSLFMTGIFPDRVYYKATYGRKAPGFDYYEQMGSSSYRWASRHQLAARFCLSEILTRLAENFRAVRVALNQMADAHMNLDRRPLGMDKVMRQILFGAGPKSDRGE